MSFTKEQFLRRLKEFADMTPKYLRKRYKTKEAFINYAISNFTRGWCFLGISLEDHERDENQMREWAQEIKDLL